MFENHCASALLICFDRKLFISALLVAFVFTGITPAGAQQKLAKISDTVVDNSALTFPSGSPFGSAINGLAFQQDAVHTALGWQYVAYYDGQRHVSVARRKLPAGAWQTFHFLDYNFKSVDAHNVISLGICERDGTIHLAFDHHVNTLHYRVSKPGVATHPDDVTWDASVFGPIGSELEMGKPLVITYPRFWSTKDGGMRMHYRRGSSGSGDNMLVDYNPQTGTWSNTRQIDSGAGEFHDDLGPSTHRNAYPNGYDYDATGRLHTTWVWRENSQGSNHDLNYDYSDDDGRTWHTDSGQPIIGPASIDTPGLVVERISRRQGLMNNHTQAIDSENRVHVVMWSSSSTTTITAKGTDVWGPQADRRYHHYWREEAGRWHDDVLPWVAGSRPRLFVDDHDNLIMIYGRGPFANAAWKQADPTAEGDLVIAVATAKTKWQDWQIAVEEKGPFINEMLGDLSRWKTEKVLSVMVQQKPGTLGTPSPLHIIDYRLDDAPLTAMSSVPGAAATSNIPSWARGKDGVLIPPHDEHATAATPPPAGLYVAMGDSITFGVGVTQDCHAFPTYPVDIEEYCPDGTSYAILTAKELRKAGVAGHFMNLGIGGAHVERVISDELPYLPSETTLVTLYIGTNDSRGVRDPKLSVADVVNQFEHHFDDLLSMIHAKAQKARIVLINFPNEKYLAATYHLTEDVLTLYDATSQALAGFINGHYPEYAVVDTICNPASYDDKLLFNGGVHPNDAGSAILAQSVLKVVLAKDPPPPPTSCQWYGSQMTAARGN